MTAVNLDHIRTGMSGLHCDGCQDQGTFASNPNRVNVAAVDGGWTYAETGEHWCSWCSKARAAVVGMERFKRRVRDLEARR